MTNRGKEGFTLIELLVVIAIISLLGVLGVTMLLGAKRDALEGSAKAFVQSVSSAMEIYKNDRRNGVYPPTSLEGFPALGAKLPNRTNIGIEALVVCMSSPTFQGEKIFETMQDNLGNTDEDQSNREMTIFKVRDLFEALDPWGNPYAYFNSVDYENTKVRAYLAAPEGSGEMEDVVVTPWQNPKTKSFYNISSFQLFSAGPDGVFNTEDDIGNWTSK